MTGVKVIAAFEFIKGIGALLVAVGVFDLVEKHKVFLIHDFLSHVHPHGLKKICHYINKKIDSLNDHEAKLILSFGLLYAGLRIIEGIGLWKEENWGRQIGIWSAMIYLPFELYEIIHAFSLLKVIITIINIGIVIYLCMVNF